MAKTETPAVETKAVETPAPEFVVFQASPGEQVQAELIKFNEQTGQADLRVHGLGSDKDWLNVRHTGEALHRMSPGTWRREVE